MDTGMDESVDNVWTIPTPPNIYTKPWKDISFLMSKTTTEVKFFSKTG